MKRLRISAISFLNTAPLMWDFEHGELAKQFEISYTVPSLCAEALRTGAADIGIIPAIAYQTIPDLVVIPDVAIASNGPVRSILLVSKVPVEDIKTVAVDTSSRTSVALLEILFRKGWLTSPDCHPERGCGRAARVEGPGLLPKFIPMNPSLDAMLRDCDSALLIGDSALVVDRSKHEYVVDLGEAWTHHTGKPFVYAFWAVRKAALQGYEKSDELASIFQQSRNRGLAHVEDIARDWAPRVGIASTDAKDYLSDSIDYSFGVADLQGLELFFDFTKELDLINHRKLLEFLRALSKSCRA